MKVLITGGTGFIGSRLAVKFVQNGHHVRSLGLVRTDAEKANAALLAGLGIEQITADICDPTVLEQALHDVELVYHLAAAQHEMGIPDSRFVAVNQDGTRNLIEAAAERNIKHFIYGSSIGVYGNTQGVVDENSPVGPVNIYQKTKLEAERIVQAAGDRINITIVRISETYGPGDTRLLKLFRMINKGLPFMIGSGQNLHHPIFIDDLTDGLVLTAKNDKTAGETIVLAGREVVSTQTMISTIAAVLDRKPPRFSLPLWPFLVMAWALEFGLRPWGIAPPLHRRRLDFFIKEFQIHGQKAQTLLGFKPVFDFRKGSQITANWYAAHQLLMVEDNKTSVQHTGEAAP